MSSMDPVLHCFDYALDHLGEQVADLGTDEMVAQPGAIRGHPAWVIGHLTVSCELLGGVIGLPAWLPEEFARLHADGSAPMVDVRVYAGREAGLARLHDGRARLFEAVRALDEARLDGAFPNPAYREIFPSLRHALTQVLVGHTAYHVGQVGLWRRAMGLPARGRPFE
jgi:hypothetical protein